MRAALTPKFESVIKRETFSIISGKSFGISQEEREVKKTKQNFFIFILGGHEKFHDSVPFG